MDPDRVRAYLQVACAGLGFDIGEIWWTNNNNGSSSALAAIGKAKLARICQDVWCCGSGKKPSCSQVLDNAAREAFGLLGGSSLS